MFPLRARRRLLSPPRIFPNLVTLGHPLSLECTSPRTEGVRTGGSTEMRCPCEPHTEPSERCKRCLDAPEETNEPGSHAFT